MRCERLQRLVAVAIYELMKHHDEVIHFPRWGYLQLHGWSCQTSEETSPPLSCSKKFDPGLAEWQMIGCDPCFLKRGHLLRPRRCVDPATTRAMPNDVLGQSASFHDPNLTSALGECLLPTSVRGLFVLIPHDQFADVVSLRNDRSVTFITKQSSSYGKLASHAQDTTAKNRTQGGDAAACADWLTSSDDGPFFGKESLLNVANDEVSGVADILV